MARIVTVYSTERRATRMIDMSYIRWFKISQALARRGHRVDMATAEHKWRLRKPVIEVEPNLRRVPIGRVRWADYDVVKTLFHRGFETLERRGGADHPFIISKLGSVVAPEDRPGIYFYGARREALFRTQERVDAAARFVTVLSEPAGELWEECFGSRRILLVPGAVDRELPPPGPDPYPSGAEPRCLFAGNFYGAERQSQREAHSTLAGKLNELGVDLAARGIRLYVIGPGDADSLDAEHVRYLGTREYQETWDYLRYADVGVVVAAGPFHHNNESSKLYHYLRVGLPTVSEAGFPNDGLVRDTGLGFVVPSGDMALLGQHVEEAVAREWPREAAAEYILRHHTWEARGALYDRVIRAELREDVAPAVAEQAGPGNP